jgi:Spy/CpxP family protein refolding chaperone
MKNLKLLTSTAVTLLLLTTSFTALADFDDTESQSTQMRRGKRGGRNSFDNLIMMRAELNLTELQYENIKAITEKYAQQRYDTRGNSTQEAMQELRQSEKNEIEAVLTSGQLETLKVLPAVKRTERMKEHFNLTDSQYNRILEISKQFSVRAYDMSGNGDKDAMRELRENERTQIEAILTDEQKSQISEKRKGERNRVRNN